MTVYPAEIRGIYVGFVGSRVVVSYSPRLWCLASKCFFEQLEAVMGVGGAVLVFVLVYSEIGQPGLESSGSRV